MTDWNPHSLGECVGSDWLGWLTGALAVGMLWWYIAIARRWNEARKLASPDGRAVWGWLIVIFLVCATAGYVALTLALWFPKFSVWLRISALTLQNIACPVFWFKAKRHHFHLQGVYENLGAKVASIPQTANDLLLAQLVRAAIIEVRLADARLVQREDVIKDINAKIDRNMKS